MTAHIMGQPLTLFTDTSLCDRCDRETVIVTDGTRAYVYPLNPSASVTADATVCRTDTGMEAACKAEECVGYVRWDLATDDAWQPIGGDSLRLLTAYGQQVEQ